MSAKPQTMSTRAAIMLAGEQGIRVDVHGAREAGARLVLLWGTLLLTFTAADQVRALLSACADARLGSGRLPGEVSPSILSANVGDEAYVPTIAVTYRDVPRCTVTVHASGADGPGGWAHPQRFLHINAGVVLFRIFDQAAYDSTVAVLTNAADVAETTLPPRRGRRAGPSPVGGVGLSPPLPAVHRSSRVWLQRAAGASRWRRTTPSTHVHLRSITVITWTLTSGNRTYSGAGTDRQEALAQALDAILVLHDLHTARGATGALPVCTVQLDNREPIVIRDIPALDVAHARRGLVAHLTQALTDLTGNPFAVLPSLALGDTA